MKLCAEHNFYTLPKYSVVLSLYSRVSIEYINSSTNK